MKRLTKNFRGIFITLLATFGIFSGAYSHNIPTELLDFLMNNPNATEIQIEQFIAESPHLEGMMPFGFDGDVSQTSDMPGPLLDYLIENPNATFDQASEWVILQEDVDLVDLEKIREFFPEPSNFVDSFMAFSGLGFWHILDGWDHICFLVSLFLLPIVFHRALILISVFTLAHSISLLLAGIGLVSLPGKLVESIIALSIIYVALTSVFLSKSKNFAKFFTQHARMVPIFIFGLFHGLGFAGQFQELTQQTENIWWLVLSFNIGVELGQILILVLLIPFFYFLWTHSWGRRGQQVIAILLSLMASYWLVERVMG